MPRNKTDTVTYRRLSKEFGIELEDTRRIVASFFDILQLEARALPFDNDTRIYSRGKFNEYVKVWNIPFVGRIGPVYSRYLCWRRNDSDSLGQELKSSFKEASLKKRADELARQILKGVSCSIDKDNKYKRIWIVKQDGKRLAKQVIPVKNTDKDV